MYCTDSHTVQRECMYCTDSYVLHRQWGIPGAGDCDTAPIHRANQDKLKYGHRFDMMTSVPGHLVLRSIRSHLSERLVRVEPNAARIG